MQVFFTYSRRSTFYIPHFTLKKKPAAPYSRAGGSRTTLGEEALDFRVRDGNGYGRLSVATGRKPELGAKENRNDREADRLT